MNHIRMKDRIINVSDMQECETDDENGNRIFDGYEDKEGNYYPAEEILNQADTIEELCDDFVWDNKLLGKGNVDFEAKTTYVSKGGFIPFADWEYEIYGAIWTDKGLIYVAKMNEKGELKLI